MNENIENPEIPTPVNVIPVPVEIQPQVKRGRGRPKGSTSVSKAVLPVNKAIVVNKDKTSPKAKAERLAALLRVSPDAKYNTLDAVEYQSRIEKMTLNDLQDECMKVGLKPNVTNETRSITTKTLMDLFHENRRSFIPDESGQNKTVLSDERRAKLVELMKSAK